MTVDSLKRLLVFVALCLAQVLVLNRIHLFNVAIPLLYVYFVLLFPRNYPKWALLFWSFGLGLVNDTFSNTPGVACATLTLLGVIQPYYLELFVPRDAVEDFQPAVFSLGISKFIYYALPLIVLYCLIFFALESFNFFNWLQWLACAGGSAVITFVLILTIESLRKK